MDQTITFWLGVGALFLVMTFIAILDIAAKDFGSMGKKLVWGFIALIPFIGCIAYFAFGFRKGKRPGAIDNQNSPYASDLTPRPPSLRGQGE